MSLNTAFERFKKNINNVNDADHFIHYKHPGRKIIFKEKGFFFQQNCCFSVVSGDQRDMFNCPV